MKEVVESDVRNAVRYSIEKSLWARCDSFLRDFLVPFMIGRISLGRAGKPMPDALEMCSSDKK